MLGRRLPGRLPRAAQVSQDDETGAPVMTTRDGKERFTKGKCFIIRRAPPPKPQPQPRKAAIRAARVHSRIAPRRRIRQPAPKEYVETVKSLLMNTMEAVNKFYAFGSVFSEEF
jgi:hypothetical protein